MKILEIYEDSHGKVKIAFLVDKIKKNYLTFFCVKNITEICSYGKMNNNKIIYFSDFILTFYDILIDCCKYS